MNFQIKSIGIIAILFPLIISACRSDDEETVFSNAPNPPNINALIADINSERASGHDCNGTQMPQAAAISANSTLSSIAVSHSQFMNEEDDLTSAGRNGSTLEDRLLSGGYSAEYAVENLIIGAASEEEAMELWLASEEQCKNILDAQVTEIGVGTAGPYWTLILAKPQ